MERGLFAILTRYLGGLRYPWLFGIAAALLLADLVIPDFIPFADEVMLAILTMLLGARKRRDIVRPSIAGDEPDS